VEQKAVALIEPRRHQGTVSYQQSALPLAPGAARLIERDPHGRALRYQRPHFMKFHTSLIDFLR
jgi:hypothetical protein